MVQQAYKNTNGYEYGGMSDNRMGFCLRKGWLWKKKKKTKVKINAVIWISTGAYKVLFAACYLRKKQNRKKMAADRHGWPTASCFN